MGVLTSTKIEGLRTIPLKKIPGDKGMVLHVLRSDSEHFSQFGEVYVSITNPGEIKGWKYHKEIGQNFAVPFGKMRMVFFDDRENSNTRGNLVTIETGIDDYFLIQVPPCIWYAFQTVSKEPGYIINCATGCFTEGESKTIPFDSTQIPDFARKAFG